MAARGNQGAWRTADKGKGVHADRIDRRIPQQQSDSNVQARVDLVSPLEVQPINNLVLTVAGSAYWLAPERERGFHSHKTDGMYRFRLMNPLDTFSDIFAV